MKFIDNFSEAHMLFSEPVTFTIKYPNGDEFIFYMKLPTIKDLYCNENIKMIIGLFNMEISEIQTKFGNIPGLNNHFALFDLIGKQSNAILLKYLYTLVAVLQYLNVPIELVQSPYEQLHINQQQLMPELFERIRQILLISCGVKKQSDFYSDPRLKAMQDKINKIKGSGNKQSNALKNTNFTDCYIILLYEFGIPAEQITNMTQYAVNFILGYTNKSIRYKTSLIAAGNGNTKKIKFITDKGK